jgi:hypothetical protein
MYKPNLVFPLEFGGTLHTIIFVLPSLASYRSVTCPDRRGCFFPFLLKGTPQTIIFLPSLPGIMQILKVGYAAGFRLLILSEMS